MEDLRSMDSELDNIARADEWQEIMRVQRAAADALENELRARMAAEEAAEAGTTYQLLFFLERQYPLGSQPTGIYNGEVFDTANTCVHNMKTDVTSEKDMILKCHAFYE